MFALKRSIADAAPAGAVSGTDVPGDVTEVSGEVICVSVLDVADVVSVVTADEVGVVVAPAAVVGTASGSVLPVLEQDTATNESRATQAKVRIFTFCTVLRAA